MLLSVTKYCAIYLDIPQGNLEAVALRLHFRPNKHQHAYNILGKSLFIYHGLLIHKSTSTPHFLLFSLSPTPECQNNHLGKLL